MNKTILLNRLVGSNFQTIGVANLIFDGYIEKMSFKTLEPQFNFNEKGNSSIPARRYKVVVRYSKKYGRHLVVLDVDGRELILFHWGNFRKDTQGCILVGEEFIYLDGDDNLDISHSKKTFDKLMSFINDVDEINLVITPALKLKN